VRVVSHAELVIGLAEIAAAGDELALAVALEAGARHDVEHPVGAITLVGTVAAALGLQVVDVLGIDLRTEVARDVGIGYLHPVDLPAGLVAAAYVQLVVDE